MVVVAAAARVVAMCKKKWMTKRRVNRQRNVACFNTNWPNHSTKTVAEQKVCVYRISLPLSPWLLRLYSLCTCPLITARTKGKTTSSKTKWKRDMEHKKWKIWGRNYLPSTSTSSFFLLLPLVPHIFLKNITIVTHFLLKWCNGSFYVNLPKVNLIEKSVTWR